MYGLGKQEHRTQALFNHTEEYVMFPDEATTSLCAWNARNASRQQLLSLGNILMKKKKNNNVIFLLEIRDYCGIIYIYRT